MPDTRFAKLLCQFGCSCSTPAAPHEAARLSQEVTLWPRVLSQCRCHAPHILSEPVLPSRPHHVRACHAPRSAIVVPCASMQRTRQNRCRMLPSLVRLVPFLRRRDHIWPSFSSLRSENETANVADDGLARFDSCFVRIVQDGLEGVVTRSCSDLDRCTLHVDTESMWASSPNVSEVFPDSSPHVSMWPSRCCAPFRSTFQASEHCCTIRDERRSLLRA